MDDADQRQLGRAYMLLARLSSRERGGSPELLRALEIIQGLLEPSDEWDKISIWQERL